MKQVYTATILLILPLNLVIAQVCGPNNISTNPQNPLSFQ